MRKKVICLFLLFGILIGQTQAQSSSQLKKDKQKIEKEIANTQSLIQKNEKNQKASLQQIALLRKQISNRERMITNLNGEIMNMESSQENNEKEIKNLQKKLEYMKSDYAQVVYMAYRNRRMMNKITFILAAEDFSQAFRRIRFYSVFSENIKSQTKKIANTQDELKKKNEEIIALKDQKLTALSSKENEIKQLEKDRRKKTQNAEQLKKQKKQLTAQLQEKQKKRKELDAAIQRAIKAEIAAANSKKKSAGTSGTSSKNTASTSGTGGKSSSTTSSASTRNNATIALTPEEQSLNTSFVNNKGSLPWPVAKGAKVGEFGNYVHPDVPSVMIENRGIDIMTDAGTPVRAIFQGEVTAVLDILGTKVVMIRHGEYLSVYQNLANVTVKKGSKVTTKQNIGTVAKNSSTNTFELHFEIWQNESYLNPNSWLARR